MDADHRRLIQPIPQAVFILPIRGIWRDEGDAVNRVTEEAGRRLLGFLVCCQAGSPITKETC